MKRAPFVATALLILAACRTNDPLPDGGSMNTMVVPCYPPGEACTLSSGPAGLCGPNEYCVPCTAPIDNSGCNKAYGSATKTFTCSTGGECVPVGPVDAGTDARTDTTTPLVCPSGPACSLNGQQGICSSASACGMCTNDAECQTVYGAASICGNAGAGSFCITGNCHGDPDCPSTERCVGNVCVGSDAGNDASVDAGRDATMQGDAAMHHDAAMPVDAVVPPALDCTFYCNTILANCTSATAQFTSMASCLSFCAYYPPGSLSDQTGNTLGCRIHHAQAAATHAASECANAGPTGGGLSGTARDGGTNGACGAPCDIFCIAGPQVCSGQLSPLECGEICSILHAQSVPYSTADTTKNDIGCRFSYLTLASVGDAGEVADCPNTSTPTPACTQ